MSYQLYSQSGSSISFTAPMWSRLLWLAERHGWQPEQGDVNYERTGFGIKSYYVANNDQPVSGPDARSLAQALRQAQPFLVAEVIVAEKLPLRLMDPFESTMGKLLNDPEFSYAPEGYFAAHSEEVAALIAFIEAEGGFVIK